MRDAIDHQDALIYTMVLVSAAEGRISDSEVATMTRLVRSLPVFEEFDPARIDSLGQECADLLKQEDGLDVALKLIAKALPQGLRETAYALACDVVASDGQAGQAELQLLELLRPALAIDRLVATAIERGAQARHRTA